MRLSELNEFDVACLAAGTDYRLIKLETLQANGIVERFNGQISEILNSTHFEGSWDLNQVLTDYLAIYNQPNPQKSLGHTTPIEALMEWQQKKPELFKKGYITLRTDTSPVADLNWHHDPWAFQYQLRHLWYGSFLRYKRYGNNRSLIAHIEHSQGDYQAPY